MQAVVCGLWSPWLALIKSESAMVVGRPCSRVLLKGVCASALISQRLANEGEKVDYEKVPPASNGFWL